MENKAPLAWSEKYRVGHQRIDDNRKLIFEIRGLANKATSDGRSSEMVQQILSNLMDFSPRHFPDEEEFMQSIGFPDLKNHRESHLLLLQKTEDFIEQLRLGYSVTIHDVLGFLEEWIYSHLLDEDMKIMEFSELKTR